jgi:hypothetical protein
VPNEAPLLLAYADPPYPGKAHLYADHPDYAGEVDHVELLERLVGYDGWALSTSAAALRDILALCPPGVRVLAWVKNTVRYGWEPVIVSSARPPADLRDWIHCETEGFTWRPIPESYVIGQKPEAFSRWIFEWLGARPDDLLDDLFPGSGAVGRAWEAWRVQPGFFMGLSPTADKRAGRRSRAKALRGHPQLDVEGTGE